MKFEKAVVKNFIEGNTNGISFPLHEDLFCGYCQKGIRRCGCCKSNFKNKDAILCLGPGRKHVHDSNLEKLASGVIKQEYADE